MVACKKCKLYLSVTKDDVLKCGECNSVFHKKCVKNIKQFQQKELCEECSKLAQEPTAESREGTPKPIENPIPKLNLDHLTIENLLAEVNKKLDVMYKMEKDLGEIKTAVEFYAEKYQEMFELNQQAEKKIKQNKKILT